MHTHTGEGVACPQPPTPAVSHAWSGSCTGTGGLWVRVHGWGGVKLGGLCRGGVGLHTRVQGTRGCVCVCVSRVCPHTCAGLGEFCRRVWGTVTLRNGAVTTTNVAQLGVTRSLPDPQDLRGLQS